jgi:hypothetical protein
MLMQARFVTAGGQAAVLAVLAHYAELTRGLSPWMAAADLANLVGAGDVHDPAFEAVVQSLFAVGSIRLMAGGSASGKNFYRAMLVPPA